MSDTIKFRIDGQEITAKPGQSIIEAADEHDVYIPRLCYHPKVPCHASCRACAVKVNGRVQPACSFPASDGAEVEFDTDEMKDLRRSIVEMLFIEGNHFCPSCEKSGDCELQAVAYRMEIESPRYPFQFPHRDVDASHPDILIDHDRCILCSRCVDASRILDGKNVFEFVQRGIHKKLAVNSDAGLGGTNMELTDEAVHICPVGAILPKRVGFKVPIGERHYDSAPIGSTNGHNPATKDLESHPEK
jgi:[NiFe] hydrogenase diaphorase moiety small subunit